MGYRLNSTVEGAIYDWVKTVAQEHTPGFTVLWSRQKTPENKANKVDYPFITLQVLEPPQVIGYNNSYKFYKNDTAFTRRKTYEFRVQVDIYPGDSVSDFDVYEYFNARKSFQDTYEDFTVVNMALKNITNALDLTQLISNGYENRTTFEIVFGWYTERDETMYWIESTSTTGTIN